MKKGTMISSIYHIFLYESNKIIKVYKYNDTFYQDSNGWYLEWNRSINFMNRYIYE